MTPERMPPEDAAAYWLARHDADPSAATDPAFLAWRDDHAEIWARVRKVWALAAEDVAQDPLADALRATALAARPPVWPKMLAAASVAVAVLLGAVGGWRYWAGREPATSQVAASAPAQYATRVGERRAVTLSDGTRLDLDSATRIDVAFNAKARRLRLVNGQAYIQVGRDATRPFAVDAAGQTIIDRGTEFGVSLQPGALVVFLTKGSVAVGPHGAPPVHQLTPGQQLLLRDGQPAVVEPTDPKTALAWRDGFVEFSDTPLSQAVAEMNRHGGRKMVIADPRIGALKISGRFKLGEPERFLRTVSLLLPVRGVRVGDTIEIRAAPTP